MPATALVLTAFVLTGVAAAFASRRRVARHRAELWASRARHPSTHVRVVERRRRPYDWSRD